MCGIVGMAGNLNLATNKMFRDLLVLSQLRGMDSTGAFVVPMGANAVVNMAKEVGIPNELFKSKEQTLFDEKGVLRVIPKIAVGHTRSATVGDTTKENAHPFQHGDIYGVHNGSLLSYRDLLGHDEHEVDSKAIFHTIAEKGIEFTWKSFYGAAALVFWDDTEKLLHIIRNDQRPLYLMQSKNKDAFFWASEDWMITVAASRNRVELDRTETHKAVTVIPEPDKLYTYEVTATSFKLLEGKKLEKKTYTAPTVIGGSNGGHNGGSSETSWRSYRNTPATPLLHGKPIVCKTDWAVGALPAPKEMRGTTFKFLSMIDSIQEGKRTFYMVGETANKNRVEVYPRSASEYLKWTLYQGQKSDNDLYFEMIRRPRVKKWGNIETYRISSEHVELKESVVKKDKPAPQMEVIPMYKAYYANVSALRWKELINNPHINGCCTCCNNPLSIEQHAELMWISNDVVLCQSCSEDPTIIDYVRFHHVG